MNMRRTTVAATAAALLALPATAAAEHRMPQPAGAQIIHADCPDSDPVAPMIGCAYPDGRVYLSKWADRFTLSHELGHVFDYRVLKPGDRNWFIRKLRLPGVAWSDYKSEVFADVYATCDLGLKRDEDGSWPGGARFSPVSVKRMARICHAIGRVAARSGETAGL